MLHNLSLVVTYEIHRHWNNRQPTAILLTRGIGYYPQWEDVLWWQGHHEMMAPLLPDDAKWIDITAPLDAVFKEYQKLSAVSCPSMIIFASGDPLFYGFANTIKREMPEEIGRAHV